MLNSLLWCKCCIQYIDEFIWNETLFSSVKQLFCCAFHDLIVKLPWQMNTYSSVSVGCIMSCINQWPGGTQRDTHQEKRNFSCSSVTWSSPGRTPTSTLLIYTSHLLQTTNKSILICPLSLLSLNRTGGLVFLQTKTGKQSQRTLR